MPDPITRRTVLATLSTVAFAPAQTPAPAPEGQSAGSAPDKLQKAYADVKENSNQLMQISIPMDLEPEFTFHV